jgi:hypothetical protein
MLQRIDPRQKQIAFHCHPSLVLPQLGCGHWPSNHSALHCQGLHTACHLLHMSLSAHERGMCVYISQLTCVYYHSFNRLHRVRSRHVLGSDWSLKLHFMLCWVVFLLHFIQQLHAVRSLQVLYGIRGNVRLNMLQLPRLCKLAVRQRLGG